jgi:hypothetical protein
MKRSTVCATWRFLAVPKWCMKHQFNIWRHRNHVTVKLCVCVSGQGEVNLPLWFLTEHHAMKAYWGGGVKIRLHAFLTSALDGGERPASRPCRFTPGEQPLVPTGWEAEWAPEPVWTRWWREKSPAPTGTQTLDYLARSPVLHHWDSPAPMCR